MYKLDNRLVREDGRSLGEVLGFFVLSVILGVILASVPFVFFDSEEILNIEQHPELRMAFMIVQGISNFFLFGGSAIVLLYLFLKKDISWFNRAGQKLKGQDFLITVVVFFAGYAFFEYIIEWNKSIQFPPEIATWARAMEDKAQAMTDFILDFDSWYEMLVGVIVVGGVVAIAEEFFFRGIVQNYLFAWTKNIHVAILITGILFSAIHFQFYGFVPRLVLSILMSYLYYISGNIWLPILLHFINNGLSVVGSYFLKDVETESMVQPGTQSAIISFLFIVAVLVYYYRQNKSFYSFNKTDE